MSDRHGNAGLSRYKEEEDITYVTVSHIEDYADWYGTSIKYTREIWKLSSVRAVPVQNSYEDFEK